MLSWFLSPLAWLLVAGALLVVAGWRKRKWLGGAAFLLGIVSLGAMTPLAANLLTRSLERAIVVPDACGSEGEAVAVVLGGGVEGRPHHAGDFSVLNLASRRRVERAVEWWQQRPERRIVMQGGASHRGATPVSGLMAAYAVALGVPTDRIAVESRSTDTWENAREAAWMSPALPRRVALVTSSIHMRRAQEAFLRNGFVPCPVSARGYRLPSRVPWALVPRTRALAHTELALHEWTGLAYYRWRRDRDRGDFPHAAPRQMKRSPG